MYMLNVLIVIITQLDSMGNPSQILLPICFVLAGIAQFVLGERLNGCRRWIPTVVLLAAALVLELSMHIIRSYAALLLVIVLTYVITLLLGVLCGRLLAWIMKRISTKKNGGNR